MSAVTKKICMVGDFGVGKTSLIRRFVERQFSDRYLSTVGVKISRKTVTLANDQPLKLLIWDLEGKTKFKAIAPTYLQGSSGVLLVADATRTETIQGLTQHMQDFLTVNPQGYIAVALNKADLIDSDARPVLEKHLTAAGDRMLATHWTSAKTGQNVDLLFETLANAF
ncbi:MAG: GTP-binding protein [Spirulina sp. SIO3F2]|nr:GTP-binding protein [Spirulina sp. SIO3F2]